MDVYRAILKRRTIRIFKDKKIPKGILKRLANAGRLAPSARNLQPLEYLVINDSKLCDLVLENVYFGGQVEKLRGKENGPVAYILVLVNKKIRQREFEHDVGLAAGNIVLAAFEKGIGSCIMRAFERGKLVKILKIPKKYFLDLIIALGFPAEKPKVFEGKLKKYWRNKKGVLYVPKRKLREILHYNKI